MSIDQDLVTRRWAASDADAVLVLAHEGSLLRVGAWTRWSLAFGVLALLLAVVGLVALPRGEDDQARLVVAMICTVMPFGALTAGTIRGVRARGRLGTAYPTVTTVLSGRERHAVNRAVDGRGPVPTDRRRVVRAAAVLRSDLFRIEQSVWIAVLPAALALGLSSSSGPVIALSLASVVAVLGTAAYAWFDVVRVRRALRATPAPWDVVTPSH